MVSAVLRHSRVVRGLVLALASLFTLAPFAQATWSIVVVDRGTGEVAIGCATCLTGFDLEIYCPVMLVGIGGACAQSSIDGSGQNRRTIWDELKKGTAPRDILTILKNNDGNHQSRQYGIVDMLGRRATFTGSRCGQWAGGAAGQFGTIDYAIQGNVLTGQPVVDLAEQALINTPGDVAEKLMAAMEAAASMGGDGRCSCDPADPDRCGSPPPGFDPNTDKSAHCGFMMISRIGDTDGGCNVNIGCSNGSYYLNHNVANQTSSDPDPVLQLRALFDQWRAAQRGRPDHVLSTRSFSRDQVPGNGTAASTLMITAIDWEGNPVGHGGAAVTVTHAAGSAGLATIGSVVDHGDGTYTVPLTAGIGQGNDLFDVVIDDGLGAVTLFPFPELEETPTLLSDTAALSAATGGTVTFDLIGPEQVPGPAYLLLASASGTTPGIDLGGVVLPLNLDAVVIASYQLRNSQVFVNSDGILPPDGLATSQFAVNPGVLAPMIGFDLAFAYFTHGPVAFASNPVLVNVQP